MASSRSKVVRASLDVAFSSRGNAACTTTTSLRAFSTSSASLSSASPSSAANSAINSAAVNSSSSSTLLASTTGSLSPAPSITPVTPLGTQTNSRNGICISLSYNITANSRAKSAFPSPFLQQERSMYSDTKQIRATIRQQESGINALALYEKDAEMDLESQIEILFAQCKMNEEEAKINITKVSDNFSVLLTKLEGKEEAKSLADNVAFRRLIGSIGARIPNSNAQVQFNAIQGRMALAFSSRGLQDHELIEFFREQALRQVHDLEPSNACNLLEAFRRWGLFDRELTDNIVERMTDEIDRFSSKDIIDALGVLSNMGLARGFLIRRLAVLAFENLHMFTPRQHCSLLYALARLRFLIPANVEDVLDELRPHIDVAPGEQSKLNAANLSKLIFTLSMVKYEDQVLHKELVGRFLESYKVQSSYLVHWIDVAWAMTCHKKTFDAPEYKAEFQALMTRIYEAEPTQNRTLLAKMFEVNTSFELEKWKHVSVMPPRSWKAACAEADSNAQSKTEGSRLHQEVMQKLEEMPRKLGQGLALKGAEKCGQIFRGDLVDEKRKIVIDIDAPNRPITRVLKHRILGSTGFKPVVVDYWRWRQCKTPEEQTMYLEAKLKPVLVE